MKKLLFFILTTTIILALNLTPLIMQYRHAPEGRTFGLIHNNVQDFYFYQALMNEGANGAALTYDPYTSEPHQSSSIFSYFLWLGKLSKLFGISYAITYHLTRIILGFLFLLSTFYFLLILKIPYPRIAYLFFLFAAPFMHTINDYGTLRLVPFMNWWNGIDPIRRAAFLPHHMLGGLLLVISIMLIFKFMNKPKRKYLILLILISALMAFVHTPSLLIILLILPVAITIQILLLNFAGRSMLFEPFASLRVNTLLFREACPEEQSDEWVRKKAMADLSKIYTDCRTRKLGFYWIISLIFLIIMISQTKTGFPWSQYIDWEKNLQFPLERELIGALGILFPFSIIGIYYALKSKKFENIFITCWLVVPFLFIPIAPKLNLSNIRLIQGIPYLPLSILAILGFKTIGNSLKNLKIKKFNNLLEYWSIGVLVFIFIIFTYPTLQWSLKDQIREYMPIYGNVYLDNRLFDTFKFINNNFPAKTITLCTFYCGNYLPAYTNTISFIGHFGYTYNEKEKEENTMKFFKGEMTEIEAKNFILGNKIALIFQGPEEKPLYKDYLYPSLLKIVYDKEEATLYKPNF